MKKIVLTIALVLASLSVVACDRDDNAPKRTIDAVHANPVGKTVGDTVQRYNAPTGIVLPTPEPIDLFRLIRSIR